MSNVQEIQNETGTPAVEAGRPHVPVIAAPRTGLRILVFVVLMAVALGAIVVWRQIARHRDQATLEARLHEDQAKPSGVDVVRVGRASPARLLSLPGEARAFYETTIFARTSGYLSKWYFDIGDPVKEGQTLANIETPELDAQLIESKAKVDALRADVRLAQAAVNFARVTYERWKSAGKDVVSQQETLEKQAGLESSEAKLASAQAQLALGQADVQRLESMEKFKNVVAPFDGRITDRHIDIGALITAGSSNSTTPLFNIVQANQIRVFVDVPQSAVPDIKAGMPVVATAEQEFPGRTFEGKVDRTAESIDPRSRTLRVEVLVPNADHALIPGMYLQVSFETRRQQPPLTIPAAALVMRPDGPAAAVVADDGRVTFHPIKIARDMGDHVEVSSGLSDGDTVALNISHEIVNGDRVTPHASNESAPTKTLARAPELASPVEGPAAPASMPAVHSSVSAAAIK